MKKSIKRKVSQQDNRKGLIMSAYKRKEIKKKIDKVIDFTLLENKKREWTTVELIRSRLYEKFKIEE